MSLLKPKSNKASEHAIITAPMFTSKPAQGKVVLKMTLPRSPTSRSLDWLDLNMEVTGDPAVTSRDTC